MWLLENLNYLYDSHLWSASIFGPCWLRSRKRSRAVLIISTSSHWLLSTYSAKCFKTLFLRITIALCNKLFPLHRWGEGFRVYTASNHKACTVGSRNESTSLWFQSLGALSCGTRGTWGERGLSTSKGEPSPSPAGHLAGCVNRLVL